MVSENNEIVSRGNLDINLKTIANGKGKMKKCRTE